MTNERHRRVLRVNAATSSDNWWPTPDAAGVADVTIKHQPARLDNQC